MIFCTKGGWFDSLGVDVSPVRKLYEPIGARRRFCAAMRSPSSG